MATTWIIRDGERVEVPVEEIGFPGPSPVLVPLSASKLGLKRALSEIGQWNAVKTFLAADPDIQEEWDLAIEIKRSDPLTQGVIAALGLTEDQVDQLIIRANELVA